MNFQTSKFDKSIYLVGPVRPLVEEWGKEGRLIDPLELWSPARPPDSASTSRKQSKLRNWKPAGFFANISFSGLHLETTATHYLFLAFRKTFKRSPWYF